jgi:hypothetical protein
MAAITLICCDCNERFEHSEAEQEWFVQNGGWPPPIRCLDCRVARKRSREARASRLLSSEYEWERA